MRDISPAIHAFTKAASGVMSVLKSAYQPTSFPIVIGRFHGAGHSSEDGRAHIEFRTKLTWEHTYHGKPISTVMSEEKADGIALGEMFIAVCNPFHTRKDPDERTVVLPLLKIANAPKYWH